MTKNIIAFTGMMGSGKSRLAKTLSNIIKSEFIDLDELISNENGSIENIFNKYGEKYFRELEHYYLNKIIINNSNKLILATGGGIIVNHQNRKLLKNYTYNIYLDVEIKNLLMRIITNNNTRPLLKLDPQIPNNDNEKALFNKLSQIYQERKAYYLECADYVFCNNDNNVIPTDKLIQIIKKI